MSEFRGENLMADVFPNAARTSAQEDGNRFDRSRSAYMANRALVEDILSNVTDEVLLELRDNQVVIMRSMQIFNNGGAAVTVYVKFVPAGIAAASWIPMYERTIASKDTECWFNLDSVLESGTTICAWASVADDILLKINGLYTEGQ